MKINTNIKKNFLTCFDEARGVALYRNKILTKKTNKCFTFLQTRFFTFLALIIISLICMVLGCFHPRMFLMSCFVSFVAFIYLAVTVYQIVAIYKFRKEQGFDNTVTFSKEGMIDESFYGIKMTFKWEKVLAVVIKKYTITILTDTPAYFYFNITEKNNILKALEKYQVKDKVIDSDFSN